MTSVVVTGLGFVGLCGSVCFSGFSSICGQRWAQTLTRRKRWSTTRRTPRTPLHLHILCRVQAVVPVSDMEGHTTGWVSLETTKLTCGEARKSGVCCISTHPSCTATEWIRKLSYFVSRAEVSIQCDEDLTRRASLPEHCPNVALDAGVGNFTEDVGSAEPFTEFVCGLLWRRFNRTKASWSSARLPALKVALVFRSARFGN